MKKLLVLGLMVLFAGGIFAQPPGPKGDFQRRGLHAKGVMNLPGLTEEQADQIEDINQDLQKEALQIRNKINEEEAKLRTLTMEEDPNLNKIERTVEDMGELRTDLRKKRVLADMQIRSLLNDEQKMAFDQRRLNKGRKRDRGPDRPMPPNCRRRQ